MIDSISNHGLLAQMEQMKIGAKNTQDIKSSEGNQFGSLFTDAINRTNGAQKSAHEISRRFIAGEAGVSAADVMRLNHEAEISMATTTQVRNKLLEQYKEILNTQL